MGRRSCRSGPENGLAGGGVADEAGVLPVAGEPQVDPGRGLELADSSGARVAATDLVEDEVGDVG